jgi:hypothetical protein
MFNPKGKEMLFYLDFSLELRENFNLRAFCYIVSKRNRAYIFLAIMICYMEPVKVMRVEVKIAVTIHLFPS